MNAKRGGVAAYEDLPEPAGFSTTSGGVPARRVPAQQVAPPLSGADLADLIAYRAERLAEIVGEYPATPPGRVGALLGCGPDDLQRAATKAGLGWDERAGEWRSTADPARVGAWRVELAREGRVLIEEWPGTSPAAMVRELGALIPDAVLDGGADPAALIKAAIEGQSHWRWRGYLGSLASGEWLEEV